MRQIGGRVERIVGEDQKFVSLAPQSLDERVRPWDQFIPAHDHAVHIDEIGFGHSPPAR